MLPLSSQLHMHKNRLRIFYEHQSGRILQDSYKANLTPHGKSPPPISLSEETFLKKRNEDIFRKVLQPLLYFIMICFYTYIITTQ